MSRFLSHSPRLFLFAVLLQLVFLFSIAGRYWHIETTGETYFAKATGVDPNDIFRGNYVRIGYGKLSIWSGAIDSSIRTDDRVYVIPETVLRNNEKIFSNIASISIQEPSDGPYFRATVSSVSYDHPEYSFETPSERLYFQNIHEWVYDSNGWNWEDTPKTRLSVGEFALVELSSSWAITSVYTDINDCTMRWMDVKRVESNPSFPESERLQSCETLPRLKVLSVSVPKSLSLNYGADRFFVKEKSGWFIEKSLASEEVYAVWKVSDTGTVILSGLEIGWNLTDR